MKNKFRNLYNKYINLRNYFLKDLSIRKLKIKGIWNKANFSTRINTSNSAKSKTRKINKKNKLFLNKDLFDFQFPKNINLPFVKFISKENTYKKINFKKFSFDSNLKNFSSDKLKVFTNKLLKNSIISKGKIKVIDEKLEKYLNFKIADLIKTFSTKGHSKSSKNNQLLIDLLGIYYVNNKLFFVHLQREDSTNIIKDIAIIEAPGDLIGDYKIEKVNDVKRIIVDIVNIFELNNPPIILLLSSSFFTTRSFSDSELVVFSDEDPVILSKSPYLPGNTLVQYKRVNGDKNSSYHRVVYADKEVIDSWVNVISLSGFEVATVTCPAIHLIEKINYKIEKEISILCDIEDFITSVYILRNNCELFSKRLPFGSSFYITGEESLNDQFFSRLQSSVKNIILENKLSFDDNIYLNGNGIDKMLSLNNKIKDGFIRIPKSKYKPNPEKASDFKGNESILNSFSNVLDILIK